MKSTEYTTYDYKGKKYLKFENIEFSIFGFKRKITRFIPTKHSFNEKGDRIKSWKLTSFPNEMNDYNSRVTISGEEPDKESFITRYPNIKSYLIELNNFLKNY